MIGLALLAIALILYFTKYRYFSYFLYLSFMFGGFGLWTDDIIGRKNMDLAIIYTFVISVFLLLKGQWKIPKWSFKPFYIGLIIMVFACALFSYFHYRLSSFQILQGGRSFLLVFSLPILLRVTPKEFRKCFKLLLLVCTITSILYILQIILRQPMMPYGEWEVDQATGLPRFYNIPANLQLFLTLSFLKPELFHKRVWLYRLLFFGALVCTLGRTFIATTILMVLLAMLMQGKLKRIGETITILGIFILPFYSTIEDRFSGGGGTSDFSNIAQGGFRDYKSTNDGGTMVYRFAWVYERWDYMTQQPKSELLLGLGFVSESQSWVYTKYHFMLGLPNEETGLTTQLSTPDISYGNLLTKLGLLGGIVYLAFAISLTIFLFKKRKENIYILIGAAQMIVAFLNSFAGSTLSDASNFCMIFLMLSTIYTYKKSANNNISLNTNVVKS